MGLEKKLKGSVEKWDRICFEDKEPIFRHCPFCEGSCLDCWLSENTRNRGGGSICTWLWGKTSDNTDKYTEKSINANMQMYMLICMLYHEYCEATDG